jgi:histidine triad (HIT) family protein
LIIPKNHVKLVADLDPEDAEALFKTVHTLIGPVLRAVKANASTIGINDGIEAGQIIPHVHLHIIPRFKNDGGGTLHSIMGKGAKKGNNNVNEITDNIKTQLSGINN